MPCCRKRGLALPVCVVVLAKQSQNQIGKICGDEGGAGELGIPVCWGGRPSVRSTSISWSACFVGTSRRGLVEEVGEGMVCKNV